MHPQGIPIPPKQEGEKTLEICFIYALFTLSGHKFGKILLSLYLSLQDTVEKNWQSDDQYVTWWEARRSQNSQFYTSNTQGTVKF